MDIKEFLLIQDLKKQYLEQYKNSIQRGSYDYYLYHNQNNTFFVLVYSNTYLAIVVKTSVSIWILNYSF